MRKTSKMLKRRSWSTLLVHSPKKKNQPSRAAATFETNIALRLSRGSRDAGELGAETQRGNVKKVDIQELSGAQVREKLARVVENVEGTFGYVADSAAGADDIFGWLFEAGTAGDFIQAASAFELGAAIVDRLARS
jgi:hypothetical protein